VLALFPAERRADDAAIAAACAAARLWSGDPEGAAAHLDDAQHGLGRLGEQVASLVLHQVAVGQAAPGTFLPPEAELEARSVGAIMDCFAAHGYQRVAAPLTDAASRDLSARCSDSGAAAASGHAEEVCHSRPAGAFTVK